MSTFSSQCRDGDDDPIDVAWSFVTDEIRLWVKCDDDKQETTTYLTIKEAEHLIELMQLAIKNIYRTYGK